MVYIKFYNEFDDWIPFDGMNTRKSKGWGLAVAAPDKYYCKSEALEPLDSINISHRRRGQTRERANVALLNTLSKQDRAYRS